MASVFYSLLAGRKNKNPRYAFLFFLVLLLTLIPVAYVQIRQPNQVDASWYDETYLIRQSFSFVHNASIDSERRVTFSLDTAELIAAGVMQADCDDTRFTDIHGKQLKFELTGSCNNAATTYEVVFPNIINGTNIGYVYYHNPMALSASESVSSITELTPSGGDPSITNRTAEEQSPGPIGYWKFDEGADDTCSGGSNDTCDSSGHQHDGVNFGATWQTEDQCVSGKCLWFDGADDAVILPTNMLDGYAVGSVCTWFRWTVSADSNIEYHMFSYADGDTIQHKANFYISDTGSDDAVLAFHLRKTTGNDITIKTGNQVVKRNVWQHTCITQDGSGLKLYLDGQLQSVTSTINGTGSANDWFDDIGSSAENAAISGTIDDSPGQIFLGYLDEVKVYSKALTADKIRAEYAGGSVILGLQDTDFLHKGLVGYWPLDHTSGNATDASGNSLTLTNNSTVAYQAAKFGHGGEFVPASSEYFSTATTINNVQTVSFWVNPDSNSNTYISLTSSAYITSSSGTISATGFTNPSIYVNGVQTTSIAADSWQLVTVTTDTAINADQFYLGRQNTSYFDGTMDEIRLYNRALSPAEVKALYNWAPGPIGYWKLDENTGTSTTADSSGTGATGTLNSMTEDSWVPGKYGSALSFDGTADFINVSSSLVDMFSNSHGTIEAWVKVPDDSMWQIENTGVIARFATDNNNSVHMLRLEDDLYWVHRGGGTHTPITKTALTTNDWFHMALTWDANTDELKAYFNGIQEGATQTSLGTWSGALEPQLALIGALTPTPLSLFSGYIDEVKIYNYARTQQQILEDMSGGRAPQVPMFESLVSYYKFDEGNGSTAFDSITTSGNDGTLYGTATFAPNGKYNGAIYLDGTTGTGDSIVRFPNDAFDGFSEGTICVWINPDDTGDTDQSIFTGGEDDDGQSTDALDISFLTATDQIGITVRDGDSNILAALTPENSIPPGEWSHFCWTNDTSGNAVYIDGVPQILEYYDGTAQTDAWFDEMDENSTGYVLGCPDADASDADDCDVVDYMYEGYIDEFQIYSAALTPEEVKQLYDANATSFSVVSNEKADLAGGAGDPPIGYWKMDENTGTSTTADSSGIGTGAILNSITNNSWVSGKYGSALSFDGSADFINVYSSPLGENFNSTQGTIQAWVKVPDDSMWEIENSGVIARFATDNNNSVHMLRNQDDLYWIHRGSGTQTTVSKTTLTTNDWFHMALTWDANTDEMRAYFNGIQEGATQTSLGSWSGALEPQLALIGALTPTPLSLFSGYIDEVKVFDYTLSQAQIAYEYNRGAPLAWYKLDECTGTTAHNAALNANDQAAGNNGTITIGSSGDNTAAGTCSSGTGTEAWNNGTSGKFNGALDFDGTDDYISLPSQDANLMVDSIGSYAMWVKSDAPSENRSFYVTSEGRDKTIYTTSSQFRASIWDGSTCRVRAGGTVDTNWHHVVFSWNRLTGDTYLYVDGRLVDSEDGSPWTGTTTESGSTIGGADSGLCGGTTHDYWDGLIDDVRIYTYSLSQAQIRKIMNADSAAGSAVMFGR